MQLEYRAEERWPAGVQLKEEGAVCWFSVGMVPACVVLVWVGFLWTAATVSAAAGGHQLWRGLRWGVEFDLEFIFVMLMLVNVVFSAGWGAVLFRSQMRYGHLPCVYCVDRERGVFARRGQRSVRWREWALDKIEVVRVGEVCWLRGWVTGISLVIKIGGKQRFRFFGLFWRCDRAVVERFARWVEEGRESSAKWVVDAGDPPNKFGGLSRI